MQDIAVSSTIPDNGGPTALVKTGPGTLTLSGTTSYTGDTYLNNGDARLHPAGEHHLCRGHPRTGQPDQVGHRHADAYRARATTPAQRRSPAAGLCVNGALEPEHRRHVAKLGRALRQRHDRRRRDGDGRGDCPVSRREYLGLGQCGQRHAARSDRPGWETTSRPTGGLNITGAGVLRSASLGDDRRQRQRIPAVRRATSRA